MTKHDDIVAMSILSFSGTHIFTSIIIFVFDIFFHDRQPLYKETDRTEPPTILIVLGHPAGLFDSEEQRVDLKPEGSGDLEAAELEDLEFRDLELNIPLRSPCLAHVNLKLLMKHIIAGFSQKRGVALSDQSDDTTLVNPLLTSNRSPSSVEVIHLRASPEETTKIGSAGVIIFRSSDLIVRYREVLILPLKSLGNVRRYLSAQFPCQEGNDEIVVQNLLQKSCYLVSPID